MQKNDRQLLPQVRQQVLLHGFRSEIRILLACNPAHDTNDDISVTGLWLAVAYEPVHIAEHSRDYSKPLGIAHQVESKAFNRFPP